MANNNLLSIKMLSSSWDEAFTLKRKNDCSIDGQNCFCMNLESLVVSPFFVLILKKLIKLFLQTIIYFLQFFYDTLNGDFIRAYLRLTFAYLHIYIKQNNKRCVYTHYVPLYTFEPLTSHTAFHTGIESWLLLLYHKLSRLTIIKSERG